MKDFWEQKAKEAVDKVLHDKELFEINGKSNSFYDIVDLLNTNELMLRAKGRWVKEEDRVNHWHCSECGYVAGIFCKFDKFCPRCGTYMEDYNNKNDIEIDEKHYIKHE